jgi:hypothetical protein
MSLLSHSQRQIGGLVEREQEHDDLVRRMIAAGVPVEKRG